MKNVTCNVRITAAMLQKIEKIAADERRTKGSAIRNLLEDALKNREGKTK